MSAGDSTDFKELVRSRTNLVDLVSETVSLTPTRGGADYVGLCPFHDDHNPSFHVYPDRQSYRCWVCNEGGDCFSFVQKIEGIEFFEALKFLADRASLELPRTRGSSQKREEQRSERDLMLQALKWTEERLHDCLLHSADAREARDYLADRGFSLDTIRNFRLGYHPDDWEWLLRQARGKFASDILLKARVVGESKSGRIHDAPMFIDRVMFPIWDARGRTISFGGRLLPGREGAKYINGSEGDLFHKSEVLYAFDRARDAIRRSRRAVVMEGYTDCIAAHVAGLSNTVAVLGTALTEQHVAQLKLVADEVILIYDGDAAGQMNADRVVSKFLAQEVDLKILTPPDKLDPAEFLERDGADAFRQFLESALEAWEFKYRKLLEKHGTGTLGSRQAVLAEMLALMGDAPNLAGTIREDFLVGRLAQRLQVPEKTIRSQLKEIRSNKSAPPQQVASEPHTHEALRRLLAGNLTGHEKLEVELLEIIFARPECLDRVAPRLNPQVLGNPYLRRIYQACCDLYERGETPTPAQLLTLADNEDLKRLIVVVEDWGRDKRILEKLNELDAESNLPVFLKCNLENLHWRQEVSRHEQTRGEIAGYTSDGDQMGLKDEELLRRASEFHKQRVTKKSTI